MSDDDAARQAAIERIENRRGFVPHLICYVVVNTLLVVAWAAGGGGYFWPIWVIGPWGLVMLPSLLATEPARRRRRARR